jgi:hypothetical protein
MRNDARPVGENSPASPVGGNDGPVGSQQTPDSRNSHKHDRQSHIVHPRAEEDARHDDRDADPAMATGEPTLNTKI